MAEEPVRPIFIFSLPRAGSTLVQRVLGAHPEISTVSEPWFLLPLVYARREYGARAEYWHQSSAEAIHDFCKELPRGERDYVTALRQFCLSLYGLASDDTRYFVDKTPHYHFIAHEVMELFPEAKLLFLWRNPLSVLASYLETFRAGRWQPDYLRVDLLRGVDNLVRACNEAGERAHAVRYEDLVNEGAPAWEEVFSYLELEFTPALLDDLRDVQLRGRYGDPTGTRRYPEITAASVDKWKDTIRGPVRKTWCRFYLRQLGDAHLAAMGYDRAELLRSLDEAAGSVRSPLVDGVDMTAAAVHQAWKDLSLSTPETPWPFGEAFRAAPPLHDRLRVRLGRFRATRSPR